MIKLLIFVALLQMCFAPPVTQEKDKEDKQGTDDLEKHLKYHRYIREVVNVLESDPIFRKKLEEANETDIRSGKIADNLDLMSHGVRTKLDEIKRTELKRLKTLALRKNELDGNDDSYHHIDHKNVDTFEIEDLKRLIRKTTDDLAVADEKRRMEFKEYEMQKELKQMAELNHTTGEERQKLEEKYKQMKEKHKKHEKLNTPGHQEQIEEVWQEQDHMDQEFNPKTFFMLHDLDGNGLWDQDEVKALFVKELDKMYLKGAPEDDIRERVEEMERMRESVFREMDTNRDGFIDYNEFYNQTQSKNYDKNPGWRGLDEEQPYTNEELEAYRRGHNLHYDTQDYYNPHLQDPRQLPPHGQVPPQGYQQMPPHQGYQQMPPQGYQQMPPVQTGGGHGQFQPGNLPQAQINPQQIQIQNQMNPNDNYHGNNPNLNTNEVYSNQPNSQQQQYNQNQPPQMNHQQQAALNSQGNYPNQQQQQQPQYANQQQQPQPPQQLKNMPPPNQPPLQQAHANAVPKQGAPNAQLNNVL